jgi:hypothetical protein
MSMAHSPPQPLTPKLIRQLLNNQARANMSATYVRLMEIYCVVKIGGVAAQIEAIQRLRHTELEALQAERKTLRSQSAPENRIRAIDQEIQELERSITHRVTFLQAIDPQEESVVQSCMPLIDQYFATLGQPS